MDKYKWRYAYASTVSCFDDGDHRTYISWYMGAVCRENNVKHYKVDDLGNLETSKKLPKYAIAKIDGFIDCLMYNGA